MGKFNCYFSEKRSFHSASLVQMFLIQKRKFKIVCLTLSLKDNSVCTQHAKIFCLVLQPKSYFSVKTIKTSQVWCCLSHPHTIYTCYWKLKVNNIACYIFAYIHCA